MARTTITASQVIDRLSVDALSAELSNSATLPRGQSFDTGVYGTDSTTQMKSFTNRLFGAPFQLLESVDSREINPKVGSEYLKHFLLHSPILHVRPGIPRYSGADDPNSVANLVRRVFLAGSGEDNNISVVDAAVQWGDQRFFFGAGSKLQRRMYSLKPTYPLYMNYVNYMCRSMATLLGLTTERKSETMSSPKGTFINNVGGTPTFTPFEDVRWENYRMTSGAGSYAQNEAEQSLSFLRTVAGVGENASNYELGEARDIAEKYAKKYGTVDRDSEDSSSNTSMGNFQKQNDTNDNPSPEQTPEERKKQERTIIISTIQNKIGTIGDSISSAQRYDSVVDFQRNQITSVSFMVEPVSFSEQLTNNTAPSLIEQAIDTVTDTIGSEIAFITNSGADTGIIGGLAQFLGSSVSSMSTNLAKLAEPMTGGFATNLFTGAIQALSGQKMIYPDIYKSSNSTMDHEYTVTLTSPYGDIYNYYMNIVVPLCHLVCLAAPRMLTSNSIASPFLVQAYVPGMATCNLGIISDMTITKNPDGKDVSVNGFPLTVKVTFRIKELYNSLAISPTTDPASFLFNETLTDYMANLAGLRPSLDTSNEIQSNQSDRTTEYVGREWIKDLSSTPTTVIQDLWGGMIR